MNGYELVKKAIEFGSPERVPVVSVKFDPERDNCTIDYGTLGAGAKLWEPLRATQDEWGCVWNRTGLDNMGQVKEHPLSSREAMKNYKFPDPDAGDRFANLENILKDVAGKYVLLNLPFTLFERMHYLRGFTELLEDFYLYPEEVRGLAEKIVDFQIGVVNRLKDFKGRVHGVLMTDDWGTQSATIISLPLWREFFKPGYKRLFAAIHDMGMHTWLHSCGKVNDFINEFIEVGLDVINLGQPALAGIAETGKKFAGRICFASFVDVQTTFVRGTLDEIRAEAKLMIEKQGTPKGGFIGFDVDYECIGVAKERRDAMISAFREFGKLSC
ncbi:MAG: uroporphyrinogen decarboxylase family protein [Kiritimatiellae bacterium]|nr:uroporphyrinogen decarboxylase family protein [Kiritimatiellia bacterium]